MSYTVIHRLKDRDSKYNLNVEVGIESLDQLHKAVLKRYPPKTAFEEQHLLRFSTEYAVFSSAESGFAKNLADEQNEYFAEVVPDTLFHGWGDLVSIGLKELAVEGYQFLIGKGPSPIWD